MANVARQAKCKRHDWMYEQAIFGGNRGQTYAHRQCRRCGIHQAGKVTCWFRIKRDPQLDDGVCRGWDVAEMRGQMALDPEQHVQLREAGDGGDA